MSDVVIARAPGKLFVLGEYAVLDGCPAVVAAVDRHVEVTLRCTRSSTVRITAPGFCEPLEFSAGAPPVPSDALRFVLAAYRAAYERALPEIPPVGMDIRVVSRLATADGVHSGLGSSAAVTVAAVAALFAAADREAPLSEWRDAVFATALDAHRMAQGGIGSGADVAASVYGGTLAFEPRAAQLPRVTPLALPADATLLAAWSGDSASTPELVKHYLAMRNGTQAARAAFVATSRQCVAQFVSQLGRGVVPLDALDANGAALEQLGATLGVSLVTPRLHEIVTIARAHGAGAKVSGAGGGDCGIALTANPVAAETIRTAWREAHLTPLDLRICQEGVTVGRG
jgi:mevalonate kinase